MSIKEFKDDITLRSDKQSLEFLSHLVFDDINDEIEIIYYALNNRFTIKNHTKGHRYLVYGLSRRWQVYFMLRCNHYLDNNNIYNLTNKQLHKILLP